MEFCTQTASVLSSSWLMMPKQLTLIHLSPPPPPTWLGQHFGLLRHNYAGVHYIPHSRAENFYPWQFSLSLFFVLLRRFLIQYYETKLLKRSFPSGLKIEDKLNSRKFQLNWRFDMHILHVIIWSSSMELWWDLNYSIQRWVN